MKKIKIKKKLWYWHKYSGPNSRETAREAFNSFVFRWCSLAGLKNIDIVTSFVFSFMSYSPWIFLHFLTSTQLHHSDAILPIASNDASMRVGCCASCDFNDIWRYCCAEKNIFVWFKGNAILQQCQMPLKNWHLIDRQTSGEEFTSEKLKSHARNISITRKYSAVTNCYNLNWIAVGSSKISSFYGACMFLRKQTSINFHYLPSLNRTIANMCNSCNDLWFQSHHIHLLLLIGLCNWLTIVEKPCMMYSVQNCDVSRWNRLIVLQQQHSQIDFN